MKIHLHVAGRQVYTKDLAPKSRRRVIDAPEKHDDAAVAELVHLLMEALERAESASTTNDEEMGHPFHGNQYTDVPLGPKPESAKASGAKAAVHELLSSGHSFTFEELMKATGAKNALTLSTAISDLKNPKYAGKLGALQIVKQKSGHYSIEKAPAGMTPTPAPSNPFVPPAGTPAPKKLISNVLPYHAVAPDKKLSVAEADANYKESMNDFSDTTALGMAVGKVSPYTLAHAWKQKKANAMAQWAANTSGNGHEAKPVEVFPEDLELMKDFKAAFDEYAGTGDKYKQALLDAQTKWKAATAAAKAKPKTPTPAPTATAAPKQAVKAPALPPASGHALPVPTQLVPDDHEHIDKKDFEDGHFATGINDLKSKLEKGHTSSVGNKKSVQAKLKDRLKDSPAWQWLANHPDFHADYSSAEATLISCWAGSSGDGNSKSCAMQLAAKEVFGMKDDHVEMTALTYPKMHGEEKTFHSAAKDLGVTLKTPAEVDSFKSALKDFVLAQYHETQDHMKQLGVKHVYLARGMHGLTSKGMHERVNLKLQPASSFSANIGTAKSFAGGESLFLTKVPVTQLLSSYVTGFGCTNEHEVVVLAHKNLQAVHINSEYAPGTPHELGAHALKKVKW